MSSLDLALGDIIAQNKTSGGGGGGKPRGGRRQGGGGSSSSSHPLDRTSGDDNGSSTGPVRHNRRGARAQHRRDEPAPYTRSHVPTHSSSARVVGDTVRVSNIDSKHTESDLRYIFEKIGTLVRCNLFFNASGESTGTGEVQFTNANAAEKAVKELDQAEIDGRLMFVQIVGTLVQPPVIQRRREENGGGRDGGRRDGGRNEQRRDGGGNRDRSRQGRKGGNEGGRGGEGRRGGKGGRNEKPEANSMDLDSEMEAYHASRNASSGAAASSSDAPAAASSAPVDESKMN